MTTDIPQTPTARPQAQAASIPRSRRWLPYVGAFILLALIGAGLWPRATPVETVRAIFGPLRSTITEEGKTRIRQRYVVSAPVAGHLRRITLKVGDVVEAGRTVVAMVDPISSTMLDARGRASADARRDAARANLEKARAGHVFATADLQRVEKLFAAKMVTLREIETARFGASSAAKETAAAESALRLAEAELADFVPDGAAARLVAAGRKRRSSHLQVAACFA